MEGPRLKKKHFYPQVQGEMTIKALPWCDFVVWTSAAQNSICIDRVYFDLELVSSMMPTLVAFYMHHCHHIVHKILLLTNELSVID